MRTKLKFIDFESKKFFYSQEVTSINHIHFNEKLNIIIISAVDNFMHGVLVILKDYKLSNKLEQKALCYQSYKSICSRHSIFKTCKSDYMLFINTNDDFFSFHTKIGKSNSGFYYSKQTLIISSLNYTSHLN